MQKTIFQKIIEREIPADIVYEDDNTIMFLDIRPKSKGHILVVPKHPYRWIQDMDDPSYIELMMKIKKAIEPLKKATSSDYIQISIIGEEVPHVHIHMIPRKISDSLNTSYRYKDDQEKKEIANKIQKELEKELKN